MKVKMLFWLYKSKANEKGEAPLYLRITINGKKSETATGYLLKCSDWDCYKKQAKGKSENSVLVNNYIALTTSKFLKVQNELNLTERDDITVNVIKEHLLGINSAKKTLIEVFEYHNAQIKAKLNKGYSLGTHKHYEVSKRKVIAFLNKTYHNSDFALENVSHKFLSDFESYLRVTDGLSSNSAMKKLTHLKTVINLAIANDWLSKNPFANFKCTYRNPTREVLTKDEIEKLISKQFASDRLRYVRDIFIFCCYTGLRYSDVAKLTLANVVTGFDGKKWLSIDTVKTNTRCNIPLLEPALQIIEKYKDNAECLNKRVLFPVKSNQKTNEYLKEIADVTGIQKHLHFHLSRHTFATTIMLENGVSLESVGKMLSQKNIQTTQIYAKASDLKVSKEIQQHLSKIELRSSQVFAG